VAIQSSSITHHRARVGALSRDRAPDDPELIGARRDLEAAKLAAHVSRVVNGWPVLTPEQLDRIATISRTLSRLMGGRRNVAGPTLASLGTNFGLSSLLGKPLAVISDARLGNTPSHIVVERLLSITGEDMRSTRPTSSTPKTSKTGTRST
jgi:hypothetical protein